MSHFRLPGAYPEESLDSTSTNPITTGSSSQLHNHPGNTPASAVLDHKNLVSFEVRHFLLQKAKHQQHLIIQLESIIYILIAYQFIKFCHLACLLPVLLHFTCNMLLGIDAFTSDTPNLRAGLPGLLLQLDRQQQQLPAIQEQVTQMVLAKLQLTLFWKTITVLLYHTLFIAFWVLPLVESGQNQALEHGTWWFVTFIGEELPQNLVAKDSFWSKLALLGLPGLLITDLVILFLQLVLYQVVYVQSGILQGTALNESEEYRVRTTTDIQSTTMDTSEAPNQINPLVLKVRLYECFKLETYIRTSNLANSTDTNS